MKLINVYGNHTAVCWLYLLCREREKEHQANISFKCPTEDQHRAFVASEPYRCWYIIGLNLTIDRSSDASRWVGFVSATRRNEIGIVLERAYRGKGIAAKAIKMMMSMHEPLPAIASYRSGRWLANINPENEHSIGLFKKLGFTHLQSTYQL